MKILVTPNVPADVRELATAQLPAGCTLRILAPSAPDFGDALADAECFMGLPRMRMDAAFFARAPKLRLIQLLRAGYELVDLDAAKAAGVAVATIGDATSSIVAEHTLAMMLSLVHKLGWQHQAVVDGRWLDAKPWQRPDGEVDRVDRVRFDGLEGKMLGILGYGAIGSRVATLARAFGMTVYALDRGGTPSPGVQRLPLAELLATSDVVSLHLRLGPATKQILGSDAFAAIRPGAYVINTARGELIDEVALAAALDRGVVAGAALDTLAVEPPPAGHPLVGRPDVLLTPHTAWLTHDSWRRIFTIGYENVSRVIAGGVLANVVV